MKFCPTCNNYLFLKINNEENSISFTNNCRNCGYSQTTTSNDLKSMKQESVYANSENIDKCKFYAMKKELLIYDPTLPHINNIPCPNDSCPSKQDESINDIIYLVIDKRSMKMLYICNNCVSHWTNKD